MPSFSISAIVSQIATLDDCVIRRHREKAARGGVLRVPSLDPDVGREPRLDAVLPIAVDDPRADVADGGLAGHDHLV
jgi:hypothetical protein